MSQQVAIMVAAHKAYDFPQDIGYLPLQVGAAIAAQRLPFTGDETGENISSLNKSFCELTGLYWLWKNHRADVYGLAHYRRYFRAQGQGVSVRGMAVASSEELLRALEGADVVLSAPRNYWIETVRSHYEHAHHASDLEAVRQILQDQCADYLPAWEKVLSGTRVSLFNMFVMRQPEFDAFCSWMFAVLFAAQERIPYQSYGPYQGRVFGFLAERLLNVWVEKNIAPQRVKYLPVINLEGENLLKKALGMLRRRFLGVDSNLKCNT